MRKKDKKKWGRTYIEILTNGVKVIYHKNLYKDFKNKIQTNTKLYKYIN
jgi:hypothetical protein